MARANIPISTFVGSAIQLRATGSGINKSACAVILVNGNTDRLYIELSLDTTETTGSAVKLRAGDNPPGWQSAAIEYIPGTAGSPVVVFAPVDSAKFVQTDSGSVGALFIDFSEGTSGSGWAYRLPN